MYTYALQNIEMDDVESCSPNFSTSVLQYKSKIEIYSIFGVSSQFLCSVCSAFSEAAAFGNYMRLHILTAIASLRMKLCLTSRGTFLPP